MSSLGNIPVRLVSVFCIFAIFSSFAMAAGPGGRKGSGGSFNVLGNIGKIAPPLQSQGGANQHSGQSTGGSQHKPKSKTSFGWSIGGPGGIHFYGGTGDIGRTVPPPWRGKPYWPGDYYYWRHYPPYHWYHGGWHHYYHWDYDDRPWWGPVGWFGLGFDVGSGIGIAWDIPWHWGYWPYYNPYCTRTVVVEGTSIDYSRPIIIARDDSDEDETDEADDEAAELLESARTAFKEGNYKTALKKIDLAIAKTPGNRLLHEFRALVLFARGKYKEAAAVIYAVLSAGPGWDWDTLSSFYEDVDEYTRQLRALEEARDNNLKVSEYRFLLAYHYLSCGHKDAAVKELKEVVKLNPKDQLSAQLLAALTDGKEQSEKAVKEAQKLKAAMPATMENVVGDWTASRDDGSKFELSLTKDAKYTWKFTQDDKTQEFTGTFTIADDLLILKRNDNPVMIGKITMLDAKKFNFKLASNNPVDPGLTFSKK